MKGWKQIAPAIAFRLVVIIALGVILAKGFTLEMIETLTKKDK